MNSSPLTLKHRKGWFAAGAQVGQAMRILSDGAFKLFIYLCLNARRDTARLQTTQTEMARNLKKCHGTIRTYLREMETAGICRSCFGHNPVGPGTVEIAAPYWPYHRGADQAVPDAADTFVSEVKTMLEARACVRRSFSTADDLLARQWFRRGIPLERIEQAILMGCGRKYVSWCNNQTHAPISSLYYFESLLDEIERQKIPAEYWDYVRFRLQRMEKLWKESHQKRSEAIAESDIQHGSPAGAQGVPEALV